MTDEARDFVLNHGYDPVNGARPLRRAIERFITRPMSTRILSETFKNGDTVIVKLDAEKETLVFEPQ
jgi:ATP-dependent Clp protease ATP-binding subunit ClpA